jgi:hypothetical protein
MKEDIKNILSKIDELVKFKRDSQNSILNYCKDKSIPLEKRWDIWENYSSKIEDEYTIEPSEFKHPLLKYVCKVINNGDNDRNSEIDYYQFIYRVEWLDEDDYSQIPELIRDIKLDYILNNKDFDQSNIDEINEYLVNMIKEAIIEENFGSYKYDW